MRTHTAALSLHCACVALIATQITSPTATIDSGPLIGRATSSPDSDITVNQFLGIPFAEPPVQNLRFRPPQNISRWTTPLDVQDQPPACRQRLGHPGEGRDRGLALFYDEALLGREDEDCLYLNVYAPEGGESDKPVLFWIYGGSGIIGSISERIYDGTSFAANHDIVVVAANYRVNVFGHPTAQQLKAEERNLAQLDIRQALEWTRRNIAAFAGDPEKTQLQSWVSLRAGILMSGSSVAAPQGVKDMEVSGEEWTTLMALINCTNLILEALYDTGLLFDGAPPDNVTMLGRPDIAWAEGNVARVPILIGSNADDGSVFVLSALENIDESRVNSLSVGDAYRLMTYGSEELSGALDQFYHSGSPFAEGANTTWDLLSQVSTDYIFRCTSTFVANLTSNLLQQPTWQYIFDAVVPSTTWPQWPNLGAYHSSEIALIFGTYPRDNTTEAEAALSRSMQKQFANFVKDPQQGPGWEEWPTIAILGVSSTTAIVSNEDAEEREEVCQLYYPDYLSTLPALAVLGDDLGIAGTEYESETESISGSSDARSAVRGGFDMTMVVMCLLAVVSVTI